MQECPGDRSLACSQSGGATGTLSRSVAGSRACHRLSPDEHRPVRFVLDGEAQAEQFLAACRLVRTTATGSAAFTLRRNGERAGKATLSPTGLFG